MKNKNLFLTVLSAAFASGFMLSCSSQDEASDNGSDAIQTVSKFLITENQQLVNFCIDYNVAEGYAVDFKVYSENPYTVNSDGSVIKKDINPIISAVTDDSGKYNLSRMIPGGVKEIYVTSDCVGVPSLLYGVISNESVTPEEYNLSEELSQADSRSNKFDYISLGRWNKLGKPSYIDSSEKVTLTKDDYASIANALPEGSKVASEYSLSKGIHVGKNSQIWLSLISDKSIFNNAIAYFCYNEPADINTVKEVIAFPTTRTYSLLDGLKGGQYIKLKYCNPSTGELSDEFPAGVNIGFVLRKSAFNSIGGTLTSGTNTFYSLSDWNGERSNRVHASALKSSNGHIIIGFEDMDNEGIIAGDNDCNDILINIKTQPADAIDTDISSAPQQQKDIVIEDKSAAVRPLTNIIESAADDALLKDMVTYTKSEFKIVNGKVVGVKDEMYIGSVKNISGILLSDCGDMVTDLLKSVFVYDNFVLSRAVVRGKKLLHTTVKDIGLEAAESSRSAYIANGSTPEQMIENLIGEHRQALVNGGYIKLDMYVDFEAVPYSEFVTTIPLPPYTPFIVNK